MVHRHWVLWGVIIGGLQIADALITYTLVSRGWLEMNPFLKGLASQWWFFIPKGIIGFAFGYVVTRYWEVVLIAGFSALIVGINLFQMYNYEKVVARVEELNRQAAETQEGYWSDNMLEIWRILNEQN